MQDAGLDQAPAEAIAKIVNSDHATKGDLANLATKADLAALESRMLRVVFGAIGLATAVILAALKIL